MNKKFWLPVIGLLSASSYATSIDIGKSELPLNENVKKSVDFLQAKNRVLNGTLEKNWVLNGIIQKNDTFDQNKVSDEVSIANQVEWDDWQGRSIVEEIIKTKKMPGSNELKRLKEEIKYLSGKLATLNIKLMYAWGIGDVEGYFYVPDELKEIVSAIDDYCIAG